ncbi:hypothetical protein [Antrihabitans sp. YC2-6]|uniref:hypothetical protein n=1 Tax=Antrihabitans sp. YC2-6 TaxID=2799498 RepID=UPI0018F668E4|nr:hypothetical protein [Antrihabitans sp. YC2-6]MBJ8343700.1 hypothetical protein [Antrihabitans sp. YC2-6]
MTAKAGHDSSGVMLGGVYRDESETQHEAAAVGYRLIGPALADVNLPDDPIVIADFGAANGNNSLRPLNLALDSLSNRKVLVLHTDLPNNDFATLFDVVEHSPDSYLRDRSGVFPLVSGRSFYERVLPESTLTFGWSSSALHWLSSAPGPIPDHFFVHRSADRSAVDAYHQRSQQDWSAFLAHRAAELVSGGGLVIVDVLRDDDGLMGAEALFQCLADTLAEEHANGRITDDEFARVVYPTWFRSVADIEEPFAPRFACDAGELELLDCVTTTLADPFAALLTSDDVGAYAAKHSGFLRAFLTPSFESALDPARDSTAKTTLLDGVWRRTAELIAGAPRSVAPAYKLSAVRIRKV